MHINVHAFLFMLVMQLLLTASVMAPQAFPGASPRAYFGLWLKLRGLPELYRRRRLEKKSRELEKKLKRCWLIDMRKTR